MKLKESTFAQWVKRRRKALDLTQAVLAERIGCSVVTIQKIEEGKRRPSRQLAELLARHLDIPASELSMFLNAARNGESEAEHANPAHAVWTPTSNLPTPLTPLIGRRQEVARLSQLLSRDDIHLVTLLGPPGVGKTRLAIAASATLHSHFVDGVWFVPLAPVTDPDLIMHTAARYLGIIEAGPQPILERVKMELRSRRLLLILDNVEQLLSGISQLADLLQACPQVRALVTSRVPLRLSGEHEFAVAPLPLPDRTQPADRLLENDAVALLLARVRAFRPDFRPPAPTLHTLISICERLDGLPLAIELAAERLRQFTPAEVLESLRSVAAGTLHLLTEGARDLPPRQQTLRNAVAWSYHLLTPAEQALFAALSVFAGGFSVEAAVAVAPDLIERSAVRDALQTLLDHSLIYRLAPTPGSDLAMLATLRDFAFEQLIHLDLATTCANRHAHFFLAQAEADAHLANQADRLLALDRLEQDFDNLRAALHHLLQSDPPAALRMAVTLNPFWEKRGYVSEGRTWMERTLAANSEHSLLHAEGLRVLSLFARQQGDYQVSGAILADALERFQSFHDTAGLARALRDEGWQAYSEHESERAIAGFEQSLALYRTLGDWSAVAEVLLCLAHIMHTAEPNLDRMQALLDESLEIYRMLNDPIGIAGALRLYANADILRGDYDQARKRFAEALDLYRQHRLWREAAWTLEMAGEAAWLLGDLATASDEWEEALRFFQANGAKEGVMLCYHHLGQVARRTERLDLAAHRYRQSLALAWEMLNSKMVARCLAGLGGVALARGRAVHAARLLGAVAAELFQQPSFLPPADLADYQHLHATIERALGSADYHTAWQEGNAMSYAQAVEYALSRT